MVVNLIQFGVDELKYNTLSNSKRYFAKGFNEFYGLDEDNETGDTQEILTYAIAKSLESKKETKLSVWLTDVKVEKGLIAEGQDLLLGKVEEIVNRQRQELLTVVMNEVFEIDSVGLIDGIDRSQRTDLTTVSTTNIKEPKTKKESVPTKPKVIKQKVDVLEEFEAEMLKKNKK